MALVAVAIALAVTGALVGGSTRWAACVAAGLGVIAALPHLNSKRTATRMGPLVGLLVVALATTVAQLVPIPEALAEILAEEKLILVRDHAAAAGRDAPTWVVASYDPPATLLEVAKLFGYAALAWSATRIASQRRARPWLAAAAVGAATLVALIALAHRIAGATHLYGVLATPVPDAPPAPLVNENHLAGLTALAVPLAIGLGLAWSGTRRALVFAAALVLAATALLTASRGGVVGLVAGLVVATIVLVAQRRAGIVDDDRKAPTSITIPAIVITACALTLFGLLAARDVAYELRNTELAELTEPASKYQVWSASTPLVVENRWFGIGRGAFETTFARLAPTGDVVYSHAENSYLQAALDWGVPGAVAVALAALTLVRAALRRWRHGPLEAGALGALASIGVHDLADFSLEMPAVAMVVIVAAAILVPAKLGTGHGRFDEARTRISPAVVAARAGLLALAALAIVLAATPLARTARVERAELPRPSDPRAAEAAIDLLGRHPTDGLTAGHAAAALFARRDPRAGKVIVRALYLRPQHPGLHHLAARMLAASQRPRQAATEYAIATAGSRVLDPVLDDLLGDLTDVADAARGLPDDPRHLWRIYAALAARERYDVAFAYADRLARREPGRYEPQIHLAWSAFVLGRYEDALPAARAAHALQPSTTTALAVARTLQALGRIDEAAEALRTAPPADTDLVRADLAVTLAALHLARRQPAAARDTLAAAAEAVSGSPAIEAKLRLQLASVEDTLGHANQAAWERKRAAELQAGQK